MNYTATQVWIIILVLGAGTFAIRFSFLGLFGRTNLPPWALRLLRYTPVAVLPGLVAPLILWPAANAGAPEPARLTAALVTVTLGVATRNVLAAMFGGGVTLYAMLYFLG